MSRHHLCDCLHFRILVINRLEALLLILVNFSATPNTVIKVSSYAEISRSHRIPSNILPTVIAHLLISLPQHQIQCRAHCLTPLSTHDPIPLIHQVVISICSFGITSIIDAGDSSHHPHLGTSLTMSFPINDGYWHAAEGVEGFVIFDG